MRATRTLHYGRSSLSFGLALITAAALALVAVPVAAAGSPRPVASLPPQKPKLCPASAADQASAARAAALCGSKVEIEAGRSENTQAFVNPDGTSTFESSVVPARVHRPDGSWAAIDTNLRVRPDGSLVPGASVADVVLSGGGAGPFVTYRQSGATLTLGLPTALPRPSVEGDTAVYVDALAPGIDLRVTVTPTGFRHVLVVRTAAAAANPVLRQVAYTVGGDVTASSLPDGRSKFVGPTGKLVAVTRAASMWDSAITPETGGEMAAGVTSSSVKSRAAAGLEPDLISTSQVPGLTAKSAQLRVSASAGRMLLAPDAALLRSGTLPIFIDPDFSTGDSVWAYANTINSNWDVGGKAWVGMNPYDGTLYRSFFNFPTSNSDGSVTYKGKHVLSASFSIELYHSWSCGDTPVYAFRHDGVTVGSGGRMAWSTRPLGSGVPFLGVSWGHANKAGGCGVLQPDVLMTFGGNEAMRADVNAVAAAYWDAYPVGLCACSDTGANESSQDRWKKFYVDYRTTMSVTYNTVPGTPANLSPHNGQVACGGVVGTYSPVLRAQYVDVDTNDQLTGTFAWRQGSTGTITNVAGTSAPWNNYGTATLNLGSSAEGKQYQFQVRTNDGHDDSPWSPWCSFMVDTVAPAPPIVTAVASGQAPVYVACDPVNISTCVSRGGPGVAGAFTFSEPSSTPDVVKYVYGWDSASTTVTVAAGASFGPILLTPPHYGINTLAVYSVDGSGKTSGTTPYKFLVDAPTAAKAYWPLDTLNGHNFNDQVSGTALSTTNVTWTPDARYLGASAANFNGTSSSAAATVAALDTTKSFSVGAWVRMSALPGGSDTFIATKGGTDASGFYLGIRYAGSPSQPYWEFAMKDTSAQSSTTVVALAPTALTTADVGRWTYLLGVYDANEKVIKLYVNGTLATQSARTATPWAATGALTLGAEIKAGVLSGWFNGQIADVRVYNRVVTQDDINGTDANPATGVKSQVGLMHPLEVGAWLLQDGECFCGDSPDGANMGRKLFLSPNWSLDPNWNGDPATTPAWLTNDSHDGNGGLQLDGASGYASTTDDLGTLDPADNVAHPVLRTDQSYTVSAWVKLDATATYQMVVTQDAPVSSGFFIYYAPENGGVWKFKVWPNASSIDNTNATFAEAPAPNATSWHQLVAVLDVAKRQTFLYVDGVRQYTANLSSAWQPWQANGSIVVGQARANGGLFDFLDGTLDEIHVWQGVLSDREITDLYNAG
jgi:hypothetical protein